MPLSELEMDVAVVGRILSYIQAYAESHGKEPFTPLEKLTSTFPARINHINHMYEAKLIAFRHGYVLTDKGQQLLQGLQTPEGQAAAEQLMRNPAIDQARDPLRGLVNAVQAALASATPPTATPAVAASKPENTPTRSPLRQRGNFRAPWVGEGY